VALLERLQILIDADASGAVREFKKVGNTADRELGKATKSMDRMSAKLTSCGAGAVVGAAALGAGLAMFAKEAAAAETQQLKLTNSIKNSTAAFPGNGKALRDQASALMKVTVADDDAIVSAQALLVQFGRTSSETEKLTPLVVDLSRKMGVDLDAAAKAVGKSSEGSSGALKKMGIEVESLGLGSTATEDTIAALAASVGGFAESEGQTFAGQLDIMKNKFGELKESVGKGVLDVVNPILGIGAAAGEINPKVGETAGKLATMGAIGAGLVGTLSVGTGAVMKMRDQFTQVSMVGGTATRSLTNVGKAAAGIGAIGAAVVVYQLAKALDEASVNAAKVEAGLAAISLQAAEGSGVSAKSFADLAKSTDGAIDKLSDFGDRTLDVFNLSKTSGTFKLDGEVIQIDSATAAINKLKAAGDNKGLQGALDLLSGADLGTGGGVEMEQQRKKFVEFLGNTEKGLSDSGKAAKANAEQLDDVTGSMESLTEASKIYNGQLAFIAATQKLGADRAAAYNKAIEDTSTLDDQATAAFGMNTAYKGLFDTLNDLPKEFDVIKAALGDYTDEQNKAVEAVISFGDTAGSVLEQAVSTGGDPRMLGGIFRNRLEEVLKNAGIPPEQIAEYIGLAGLGEFQIEAAVRLSLSEEEKQKFLNLLALFEAPSQDFAPEILPKINELFLAGEFQKLNALIAASQPGVTQTELFLYLTAYPDLAGPLAGTIDALQAQADADAVALRATMFPPGSMIADLMANLQAEANAAPPVVIPFQLPGAPGSGLPTLPNRGNLPAGINPSDLPVQQAEIDTGLDFNFNGIIGRAIGGPVGGGRTYMVNERGRELFTPNSNGFIMNAGDAQSLIQGVSQLVSSGGGGGMTNNITINETSSPRQTALEVIRANKASLFLAGAL
jgi:hypothetical protein